MKHLFKTADRYIQTSDWKLFAVIKFCLLSLGVLAGLLVPKKHRTPVLLGSIAVFAGTYVPLMARLVKMLGEKED